jgi:hypothetical protein
MSHPQAIKVLPTLSFISLLLLGGMGIEKLRNRLTSAPVEYDLAHAKSAFV